MKTEAEIKAEIERVKEYIGNEGILWNVAQFQSRIAVLEWALADSAPAPTPTDEQIADDMVMTYLRTPASQSLLQRMFAVLAVAKPLIRQQMESRHD